MPTPLAALLGPYQEPTLRTLPDAVKDEAAVVIAKRLRELADDRSLACPSVWRSIAETTGCAVYEYHSPGSGRGEYAPADIDAGRGVLAVNTAYPPADIVRVYAHETSHHLLTIWVPPSLPSAQDVFRYEGDADDVRHDIARRVEALLFESTAPAEPAR